MSFAEPRAPEDRKLRGKAEKFAEHYAQATLFWNSQTDVEKAHIVRAFRFELTKVQTPAVRRRVVATLRNVADELATQVAHGLGMPLPDPLPRAIDRVPRPVVGVSSALSLMARPGQSGVATRRVAILVDTGFADDSVVTAHSVLLAQGAVPRFVGPRLGGFESSQGSRVEAEISLEAGPAALYDAVVLPGDEAAARLAGNGAAVEFVKDMYRHCKPILAIGEVKVLLDKAGVPAALADGRDDPGLIRGDAGDIKAIEKFVAALAGHRSFARETDPPVV
jgi:catalase